MKKHCITFAPFLKDINGHCLDYHLSLHRVFQSQGWQVCTFVQKLCCMDPLPDHWYKNLYEPSKWSRRSVFAKLFPYLINAKELSKTKRVLKEALLEYMRLFPQDEFTLLFETFNTFHLYILQKIVADLPRKNISVSLIYRYDHKQLFFEGKRDKKILRRLEKQLKHGNLNLFADTSALVKDLSHFFERKVHLLPIPHTGGLAKKSTHTKNETFTFWWPGAPRRTKGLSFIQKLSESDHFHPKKWTLKLSEKTPLSNKIASGVLKIPHFLSREEYAWHLRHSDVILMPYAPWNYKYSSSGIFIEAICSGLFPAVSQGLWISEELKRYGLESFIFDFDHPNLLENIEKKAKDQTLLKKLENMQKDYLSYHNETSFAHELFKVLST